MVQWINGFDNIPRFDNDTNQIVLMYSWSVSDIWDALLPAIVVFWYSTVCDLAALSPCLCLGRTLQNNQITALPSNVFANQRALVTLWVEMCC